MNDRDVASLLLLFALTTLWIGCFLAFRSLLLQLDFLQEVISFLLAHSMMMLAADLTSLFSVSS